MMHLWPTEQDFTASRVELLGYSAGQRWSELGGAWFTDGETEAQGAKPPPDNTVTGGDAHLSTSQGVWRENGM